MGKRKMKVALVLSGGGARGMAHVGVIEELEARGYEITSVAGTSMGALVGGTYASGYMDDFKSWMCSLDKRKVFQLVDFTLRRNGLLKGDRVFNTMKEFVPESTIESLRIPYTAVAVDMIAQEEVVFNSGSLYKAIRASTAIPTVVTPLKDGDRVLVDGGVLNNIPIDRVHRNRGDKLVVVNVNANTPLLKPPATQKEEVRQEKMYQKRLKDFYEHLPRRHRKEIEQEKLYQKRLKEFYEHLPKRHKKGIDQVRADDASFGYFELLNKTTALMGNRLAEYILDKYPPDILINVSRDSCGTFDFYRSEEVVENGRWAAKKVLDAI